MSVAFKDYYEILGVARQAPAEEIRRAYRQLARKYHPDTNKTDPRAEEKFKEINEAYEVLKDPEKRRRYDELGANWKNGQEFRPPPGWEGFAGGGGPGGQGFNFGGFSDFFEALFGGRPGGAGPRVQYRTHNGPGPGGFGGSPFGDFGGAPPPPQSAPPAEATIEVPLDRILHGGIQRVGLNIPGRGTRTFDVRIPKGIAEGKKIRLSGEGPDGSDIHLKVHYAPGGPWRLEGGHLVTDARITPATAALGGTIEVPTPDGPVTLKVPPHSNSGRRLRLKEKGLPTPTGPRGDLHIHLQITLPETLTEEQLELYRKLKGVEDRIGS